MSATRTTAGPAVSVVVPTYRGERHITACLRSLAAQTLPLEQFEVVLVLNGPPDRTPKLVAEVRREFPQLRLRQLTLASAGAGRARNAGMAASVGMYLTFVDDDDRVSPGYLAGLLEVVRGDETGLVAVAPVADVGADGTPSFVNYINDRLLPVAGRIVPAEQVPSALGFVAAKLVRTSLLRGCWFDTSLRSGEDLVFWYDVFTRAPFTVRVCDPVDDVVYYRQVREDSVSRRAPSYSFNVEERLDAIARLARTPPADEPAATLQHHLVAAQTGHINRFLREEPDRHLDVVRDIRTRGLDDAVPYRVLNMGVARDLAVLYSFLPSSDTSAMVSARRIHRRQVLVDVISNNMWGLRQVDPSGYRIAHEFLGRHEQLRNAVAAFDWTKIQDFVGDGLEVIARLEVAQGPYRSVYSRTMWPASHFLAAVHKIRHPEVSWIAEFSDPQLWNSNGEMRRDPVAPSPLLKELRSGLAAAGFALPEPLTAPALVEVVAYALADEIVFTNANQRDFMLDYLHDDALRRRVLERATVSHHPTLPPRFYRIGNPLYEVDRAILNIGYFGVFYATRGLDEIVGALNALAPEERNRLRLHVFTPRPDELAEQVAGSTLADVVVANPYLTYLDFLAMTTRMDVLLVNDARTQHLYDLNPYLPSKWSDYAGSGSDVWRLYEPGSVLSTMSSRYGSQIGDVDGAVRELRRMLADHSSRQERPVAAG